MSWVKTFWIGEKSGVPDAYIRQFLSECEKEAIIAVNTTFIPAIGKEDPRLTVIVTKLDDLHVDIHTGRTEKEEIELMGQIEPSEK
jgi:hypothetical protein